MTHVEGAPGTIVTDYHQGELSTQAPEECAAACGDVRAVGAFANPAQNHTRSPILSSEQHSVS